MSSAAIHPKSKTENAIYVAFGVTVGFSIVRWLAPSMFADPLSAIGVAAFLGSLIGSVLFYSKPDRLVIIALRWSTFGRYHDEMERFIVVARTAIESWRMKAPGVWETPDKTTRAILGRLTEGPDLDYDIAALRGVFYFFPAVFLGLYAAGLDMLTVALWTMFIWLVLAVSVFVNYKGFRFRCSRVSLFRILQQTYSVFRARDPGDRPTENWFIGDSTSKSEPPIEQVLKELELMLENRDLVGFMSRFRYIESELDEWLSRIRQNLATLYVKQWVLLHTARTEYERNVNLKRTVFLRRTLESLVSMELVDPDICGLSELLAPGDDVLDNMLVLFRTVDRAGLDEMCANALWQAFHTHTRGAPSPEIIRLVLGWCEQGHKVFEESIINTAEYVDEELRKSMLDSLLRCSGLEIWRKLGQKAARTLVGMQDILTDQVVTSALKSNNDEAILELMALLTLDSETVAREFVTLAKHRNVKVRDAVVAAFLDENPSRVTALLHRLAYDREKAVRAFAARLILELTSIDSKSEYDSRKLRQYEQELDNLLLSNSRDVQTAILEESLESGKTIPLSSIENLLLTDETPKLVKDLAMKARDLRLGLSEIASSL